MEIQNIHNHEKEGESLTKVKSVRGFLLGEPMLYLPVCLFGCLVLNFVLIRLFFLAFTFHFSFVGYALSILFWGVASMVSLLPSFELFQEFKHYLEQRKIRRNLEIESLYTLAETALVHQKNSVARNLISQNFRRFDIIDDRGGESSPTPITIQDAEIIEVIEEPPISKKVELFEDTTGAYYYRIIGMQESINFKLVTEWKKEAFKAFVKNPTEKTNEAYREKKELYDYCLLLRNNKMIKDYAKKHNIETVKASFVEPQTEERSKKAFSVVGKADKVASFINRYIVAVENKTPLPTVEDVYLVEYRWQDNTEVNRRAYGCVFSVEKT